MDSTMTESAGIGERPIGRRRSDRIAGASNATQQAVEQAAVAARSELPVVVVGPDGGGRSHLARAIHAWSSRGEGPLVALSVAAMPERQQRSELFGSESGGDALKSGASAGALEAAANGSLLISDADRLSPAVRETLVEALRSGRFARDGGHGPIALRARVIATTATEDAALLGDLPLHTVRVAPLADRADDILPLAVHFLGLFAEEEGFRAVGFTPDARRCLIDEPWRGNVRELRERIRQAVRLAGDGAISVEALALATEGDEVPSFKEAKRSFETRYVKGLLRRCGGNISRAARLAKKDRKDFYDVIRRTGVDPQEFRS